VAHLGEAAVNWCRVMAPCVQVDNVTSASSPVLGNLVDTPMFGDASPPNSFESPRSQSPVQLYDMAGISVDAESQPSQELINSLDKGCHHGILTRI
jgi:hypothetical protein